MSHSFDFLKEGRDKEFDKAMNSIDAMYDNLFNGDKLDKIFESLKYEDNPLTEPIDEMTKEIFSTEETPSGPKYVKAEMPIAGEVDTDFVVGEPLYPHIQLENNYIAPNPYRINNNFTGMNPYANIDYTNASPRSLNPYYNPKYYE